MKVLAKQIDMVCWFEKTGKPHPVRFKISNEDKSETVIRIDKIYNIEKEKLAGNEMLKFRCQGIINNQQKLLEIKYELRTCKWILWKM